jgi:hypothetical protein
VGRRKLSSDWQSDMEGEVPGPPGNMRTEQCALKNELDQPLLSQVCAGRARLLEPRRRPPARL